MLFVSSMLAPLIKSLNPLHAHKHSEKMVARNETSASLGNEDLEKKAPRTAKEKKRKTFATKSSMLDILDKVNQAEDSRVEKKVQRQHAIKKLVTEKEKKSADKKKKKNGRLEEIKKQLRSGYSLNTQQPSTSTATLTKKRRNKSKAKGSPAKRTLSEVNRQWENTMDGEESSPEKRQVKSVSFAI